MRLSSLMNIWIIGFEIICELYHPPDISLWTIKALQYKARHIMFLKIYRHTWHDMCHYLMCLSWVWCAPYVTFVSNNVIRTTIIKHDIHFILSNIAADQNEILKMFLWLVWLLYPPAGMKCSTVAESLKKTHFIVPTAARPWLHSLRWRWGSGQATS